MTSLRPAPQQARRGKSPNGMEFVAWGDGAKLLLFLPGGPPSTIPTGLFGWWVRRVFAPYLEHGYTVWYVTRRRGMPRGHTMSDIAADHAEFIRGQLGGHVDVVVGESLGGLIAQHLAGQHPDTLSRLVLVVSGWRVTDWTKQVDGRLVAALARGDLRGAGAAFAEYLVPGARWAWLRRALGRLVARIMFAPDAVPRQDVLVEADAERSADTRAVLPLVDVPVLLIAGDQDRFFSPEIIEETARLLPDAEITWYRGKGHLAVASSSAVTSDVLAFTDDAGRAIGANTAQPDG